MKLLISILVILLNYRSSADKKVTVSVYYETLCPDTIAFIKNQLHPTYKVFGYTKVNLEFIPYGFAKETVQDGKRQFTCQHGPSECYGNKVHGCIIGPNWIDNTEAFVACSESASNPTSPEVLAKCANTSKVAWSDVDKCFSIGFADTIMEKNGNKTRAINPQSIPAVAFNGHYSVEESNKAVADLKSVIHKYIDGDQGLCTDANDVNVVMV